MLDAGDLRQPVSGPVGPTWRLVALAVAVVVAHSALIVAGIGEIGTLGVNVGFAVLMVIAASRIGLGVEDLGLRVGPRGWLAAASIAAVGTVVVIVAAGMGVAGPDATLAGLTPADLWFRALVAIPVGTAFCEELLFRGVLLAAGDRLGSRRSSTIAVSLLFGMWHLAAEAQRTGSFGAGVLPGVLATTAASALVLCPLRRATGDLAAPVALHAVANVGVFILVAAASSAMP